MTAATARAAGFFPPPTVDIDPFDATRAEAEALVNAKYAGYIRKQEEQVERMRRMEERALPEDLDYRNVHGLRAEAREKLARFRPATVGMASRIAGINATDLSLVLVHLKARRAA